MAIVRLTYKLNSGVNYLDLAKGMSCTERRLIHQKQLFTVMGGMLVDDATDTKVKISTAPNNYYTRNAVTRGFRAWKASRAKALEASGDSAKDIIAKYSDFKVYLDAGITSSTYLNPFNAGSEELTSGEWTYSKIQPEQGAAKLLHIVGDTHSAAKYCLSLGWLETRKKLLKDPAMPDLNSDGIEDVEVDFIATMFQDTAEDTQRLNLIEATNDDQPYPLTTLMTTQSTYSSTEPKNLQLQFIHHSSANELSHSVPGFQALCGLVRVDVTNGSNPILVIDVETKGWNF
ncbi:MAG: hypothetical protein [Circular genetic element sp.]|nr:MAG: hypothetical protein [Circular genetic element sp.]